MLKTPLLALALVAVLSVSVSVAHAEPFGAKPTTEPTHPLILREWKTMPQKMLADAAAVEMCRAEPQRCTQAAGLAISLIDSLKGKPLDDMFLAVDTAVNERIQFVDDIVQWGATEPRGYSEVWTSPLDTIASRKGDCEDFVNLKLFILWQAGVSLERMRLVVLGQQQKQLHIVLAVKAKDWLVLDSVRLQRAITPEVVYSLYAYDLNIRPAMARAEPQTR